MSEEPELYVSTGPPGRRLCRLLPAPAKPAAPYPLGKLRKPKAAPAPRRKKPKSVRYGPGRYAPAPNGRGFDCCVNLGGQRQRARMPNEASARAWIDATEASATESLAPLTRAQLIDARHALALLPEGATLTDAARAWLAANGAPEFSEPLETCAARYLETRGGSLRPSTRASYVQFLARLRRGLPPGAAMNNVGPREIESALSGLTAHNRNGALRVWSAFFRWAEREGACAADPCARVARARLPEPPKGILMPEQAKALLRAAEVGRAEMIPYLAVGLFAGVRPAELLRLGGGRIGPEYIRLDGAVTKTADARTVPVSANLAAWLAAYPPPARHALAPLSKKHLYAAIHKLCAAAGIGGWPSDCMRHSYATYRYELTRDAALTASEMGHRGTDVFFRHYRALALPGDGARYFAIMPTESQRSS